MKYIPALLLFLIGFGGICIIGGEPNILKLQKNLDWNLMWSSLLWSAISIFMISIALESVFPYRKHKIGFSIFQFLCLTGITVVVLSDYRTIAEWTIVIHSLISGSLLLEHKMSLRKT